MLHMVGRCKQAWDHDSLLPGHLVTKSAVAFQVSPVVFVHTRGRQTLHYGRMRKLPEQCGAGYTHPRSSESDLAMMICAYYARHRRVC
jgi:hypothetical protein